MLVLIPFVRTVSAFRHLHVISVSSSTPALVQREQKAALARFHGATRMLFAQLSMGHRTISTGTSRGGKVRIFSWSASFLLLWLRKQQPGIYHFALSRCSRADSKLSDWYPSGCGKGKSSRLNGCL
jgi:hypothetical protein